MEVDVKRLVPGMIVDRDVVGKSGKPIVEKQTILTETHIEFLKSFLIDSVSISSHTKIGKQKENRDRFTKDHKNIQFIDKYEQVVQKYSQFFLGWENDVPFEMHAIRKECIPLFEQVIYQPLKRVITLIPGQTTASEIFFYRTIAMSLLLIYVARKLEYEKKDWLQIGFAALLSDSGKAKLDKSLRKKDDRHRDDTWKLHPVYSYKMIENVTTLTSKAKQAILQHHERLDGSGFPAQIKADKIQQYARIIAVCDVFYSVYSNNVKETIELLNKFKTTKLDAKIVNVLLNELKSI